MNLRFPITLAVGLFYCLTTTAWQAKSPNGLLTMEPKDEYYIICYRQQPVLVIETAVSSVSVSPSSPQHVTAEYQMLTGKRLHCTNEANEYRLGTIVWRLYNDGIAFRYEGDIKEQTTYLIPEGTRRWMQQWTEAYEGFPPLTTSYKTAPIPSFSGVSTSEEGWNNRWGFSWVYWAHNHGSKDYDIIKKYVDMAVALHLPYVLINAEWDEMENGKTIEDAIGYARSKGIKPLIWYNSSVGWVDGAPGPKYRLNRPEDCEREFAWCEKIGVAGVKIDFFSGDNQKNMEYCIDL